MHNRYIKYFVFLLFTADLVLSAIFLKNDHRDIEKIFSLPALSKVAGQPGYIALTFDDGPDRKCTPLLLDGLKERGVHATFFLMGSNIEGKEDIVKRMSEEGHLIGNHSYEHSQLTKAGAESANYPFCTIDPNVGVVTVPDERLNVLGEMYHTKKIVPAVIEFVDIAGLVKGASKGEGLGNQFLANIREVDAIVHVVRCFENGNIVHVDGSINPLRDIETINVELIFSDLEVLERRISKQIRAARNDKAAAKEVELMQRIKAHLEEGKMAGSFADFRDEEEEEWMNSYNLLTAKPVIFAANVSEDDLADDGVANEGVQEVRKFAKEAGYEVFVVCAEIEQEIAELKEDEKAMFLEDLGLKESGLEKLIKASYRLLGLISYLTAGEPEVRAWTIKKGTKAPQAAGKIHSDFERGFIRAEVVAYDDLIACGNMTAAKEKGLVRSEGKEYVVKDGDVVLFRFNV